MAGTAAVADVAAMTGSPGSSCPCVSATAGEPKPSAGMSAVYSGWSACSRADTSSARGACGDIGIPMGGTIGIAPPELEVVASATCFFAGRMRAGSVSSTELSFRFRRPGEPGTHEGYRCRRTLTG